MIRMINVEKSYPVGPGRYWVLRRINLEIQEGEFVTIMGPSGAGKSTLLAILGMLDGEFTGEYYFLDTPIHKLSVKQRAEINKKYIGFVFQQYHLLDGLTVAENLEIPLSYRDMRASERQALARSGHHPGTDCPGASIPAFHPPDFSLRLRRLRSGHHPRYHCRLLLETRHARRRIRLDLCRDDRGRLLEGDGLPLSHDLSGTGGFIGCPHWNQLCHQPSGP